MAKQSAAAKQKQEAAETIRNVAQEAIDATNGDAIKATDIMAARVAKNPALYRELMDPLLRTACYEAVASIYRTARKKIWHPSQPSAERERGRVIALAGGTASTLLDFPLPGGKTLRSALRSEVSAAAEFYRRQSDDMGVKARWLQMIAQHVPENKLVADVLDVQRLTELRQEAEKANG